jgi:hypothetical protein
MLIKKPCKYHKREELSPMLIAASSKLGSIALSTAARVKKATGKYVSVSAIHVPKNPYMLKSGMPKKFNSSPFGPSTRVRAILLVKGGETKGRTTTAPINHLIKTGKESLVSAKAKMKPTRVPPAATEVAKIRLLKKALRLYQFVNTCVKLVKLAAPSMVKTMYMRRARGYSTKRPNRAHNTIIKGVNGRSSLFVSLLLFENFIDPALHQPIAVFPGPFNI